MMRILVLFFALSPALAQNKNRRPPAYFKKSPGLNLPDNATSIRENIVDTFSCENRIYGYYADMDNDCQIFHVCLPQARYIVRFSFICPTETVFNQATFVCTRNESSIPCEESENFYNLNEAFGEVEEPEVTELPGNELEPSTRPPQRPTRPPPSQGSSTQKPFTNPPAFVPTRPPATFTPDYPTQRPTRPTPPKYPTIPQRPTTIVPDYPTIPQRPSRPTSIGPDYSTIPSFSPQKPVRPPNFSPQTFTSDYPATTFYYQQRPGQGNRIWQ